MALLHRTLKMALLSCSSKDEIAAQKSKDGAAAL
jgi:hypothetical protein